MVHVMTTAARDLLTTFESLTPIEQRDVADAILRLAPPVGELGGQDLDAMANEIFSAYDLEESADAAPAR